jgi:hypothetical protein
LYVLDGAFVQLRLQLAISWGEDCLPDPRYLLPLIVDLPLHTMPQE